MKNILLVEDDRITSKLIQKYIYDIGYNLASAASSPEEALEVIEKKQPDLILMDINLEGNIDGIEFANSISSKYTIPFVYITSSVDYSTIERAKKSNAYGYIIKPFDKRDLRAAVEMAFLRHEMERRIREDEKKMATILNSIVDMVVVVDSDGYINYINAAGLKMLAKERDFVIGKPISEIVKIGSDPKKIAMYSFQCQ
jgi:CheY-like chemotaxis protein